MQHLLKPTALTTHSHGQIWTSITGLVFGILPMLALVERQNWNKDEAAVLTLFAITSLVFGGISLSQHLRGRGMAIAATALGFVGLLAAIGSQS